MCINTIFWHTEKKRITSCLKSCWESFHLNIYSTKQNTFFSHLILFYCYADRFLTSWLVKSLIGRILIFVLVFLDFWIGHVKILLKILLDSHFKLTDVWDFWGKLKIVNLNLEICWEWDLLICMLTKFIDTKNLYQIKVVLKNLQIKSSVA